MMPSKKIILVLIASILAVGGVFWVVKYVGQPATYANQDSAKAVVETVSTNGAQNNSAAGSSDWKKVLSDTASTSAAGSGLSGSLVADGNPQNGKDMTATDKLAVQFFEQYLQAQKDGDASPERQQQIVDSLLPQINLTPDVKSYSISDISAGAESGTAALTNYGNELGAAVKKILNVKTRHELVILEDAVNKNDPAILKELDPMVGVYKSLENDFLAISPPPEVLIYHLELLNAAAYMRTNLEAMRNVFSDPAKYFGIIQSYPTAASNIRGAFNDIKNYLAKKGVSFAKGDSGYVFVNFI